MPVVSRNICMVYLFGKKKISLCLFNVFIFLYIFFVHSFHCCCPKVNLKQFCTGQDNHSKVCIDVWISQFTEYFSYTSQIKRDNFNLFLQKWETSAQYTGHRLTETNMETRTVSSKPNLAGSKLTHFQSGSVTSHSHYTYNPMQLQFQNNIYCKQQLGRFRSVFELGEDLLLTNGEFAQYAFNVPLLKPASCN